MINLQGGRGKKAPYKTCQVRCPEPVKPLVEAIIREFRKTGEVPSDVKTRIQEMELTIKRLQAELADAEEQVLKYYRAGQPREQPTQPTNTLYSGKNLPKRGDRIETIYGRQGEVVAIASKNPKYRILWEGGVEEKYSLADLGILEARKIEESPKPSEEELRE